MKNHNYIQTLNWLFCCLILFFIFFITPYKGFDFTDYGFYLSNAYSLSQGQINNPNLAGSFYNAILMKIGIDHYLSLEYAYFILEIVAICLFWSCFSRKIWQSRLLPLAIIGALSTDLMSMASYQTAPIFYLLLGYTSLFYAINTKNNAAKGIYFILAGFLLAFSSLGNMALIPSIFVLLPLSYYLSRHSAFKSVFLISFLLTTFVMLFIHFNFIMHNKMSTNQADWATITQILTNLGNLILHWSPAILLGIVAACIPKSLLRSSQKLIVLNIIIFITMFALAFTSNQLQNYFRFCMAFFYLFLASTTYLLLSQYRNLNTDNKQLLAVAIMIIIFAIGLASTTASQWGFENSGFDSHTIILLSGCIVVFLLFYKQMSPTSLLNKILYFIWIPFILYGLYLNVAFTYRSYPVFSPKTKIHSGSLLDGIRVNPLKKKAVEQILTMYKENHCSEKLFIAFPSIPLVYYLSQRNPSFQAPWISPYVPGIHQSGPLLQLLSKNSHWCVIDAETFLVTPDSFLHKFRAYLHSHSHHIAQINITKDKNLIKAVNTSALYPSKITIYVK